MLIILNMVHAKIFIAQKLYEALLFSHLNCHIFFLKKINCPP